MPASPDKKTLRRRSLLLGSTSLGVGNLLVAGTGAAVALGGCRDGSSPSGPATAQKKSDSAAKGPKGGPAILSQFKLGEPPWTTFDPFLFCVHHRDAFPRGTERLGPDSSLLAGRSIGRDFGGKDGWNMYHGDTVPGFPRHPHRGFETVTITRRGFVDHSDSLGATARYGKGDVQWMTAGRGIVHAEMFPLLETAADNDAELFQIWLNLPRAKKFAAPHFAMFWQPQIPVHVQKDKSGRRSEITVIAGRYSPANGKTTDGKSAAVPPEPPPHSWAHDPAHAVAIWSIKLSAGASWMLPAGPAPLAGTNLNRTLYFFQGSRLQVAGQWVPAGNGLRVDSSQALLITNGDKPAELLLLQGQSIDEPIVKHGPFVMNDKQEIRQAITDYRKTQFGGWPWPKSDPVHPRNSGRFAVHADGRREEGA